MKHRRKKDDELKHREFLTIDEEKFNIRNLRGKPATMEFTFNLESDSPLIEFARQLPDACPNCNFTHTSKMFVRKNDVLTCDACDYVLQEKDLWRPKDR